MKSKTSAVTFDREFDETYLKLKFTDFIRLLLYSNNSTKEVCNGILDSSKIFYLKNDQNEIQYYSIYEQRELLNLLFEKRRLEVDLGKSTLKGDEVGIWFRMVVGDCQVFKKS